MDETIEATLAPLGESRVLAPAQRRSSWHGRRSTALSTHQWRPARLADFQTECVSMAKLDDSIRKKVEVFLARTRLSERKLGAFAVGDPSLIPRLRAGASMRLDTADALLTYMDEEPISPKFCAEVEAFLSETGIGERTFGSKAAGDPSFVTKLRSGTSLRLYTVERVRAWMRVNKRALMAQSREGSGEESPGRPSDPAMHDTPAAATAGARSDNARPRGRTTPARQDPKMYLTTGEAAEFLTLSARTLDRYRVQGTGPVFHRFGGRVRYLRGDLLEWASARRVERTPERD